MANLCAVFAKYYVVDEDSAIVPIGFKFNAGSANVSVKVWVAGMIGVCMAFGLFRWLT